MPPTNSQPTTHNQQQTGLRKFSRETLHLLFWAIVIVIPFRLFIAQPFIVDGLSMYPTFNNGNYLIVDEISYRFNEPERGSVVVFRYPNSTYTPLPLRIVKKILRQPYEPERNLIKRIIGLPGETVKISNGQVTIINDENPSGLVLEEPYVKLPKQDTLTRELRDDEYFVMGDNRGASSDSRIWGAVPRDEIIGRPILSVVPFKLFPGDVSHYLSNEENE